MGMNLESQPISQQIMTNDLRLRARNLTFGCTQIELSNRFTRIQRFKVTCYLVGDVLIDTGFPKIGALIEKFLAGHDLRAIACTHNHEDHAGNSRVLSIKGGCPVYLANRERLWGEGVGDLPFYRRLWFGPPPPYEPEEMPELLEGSKDRLRAIPALGHSATQVAFLSENTGTLFCGDLYISGGATAVMRHENPYETVDSLRRSARLNPERLVNGHGLILENPAKAMEEKALKIEEAAFKIVQLHRLGHIESRIERVVFQEGRMRDKIMAFVTVGEFCRRNFIRACIRHHRSRPAGSS